MTGYVAHRQRLADEADLAVNVRGTMADVLRMEIGSQEESAREFKEWAQRIPTASGASLDFTRFPMQEEMYREAADLYEVVTMKGTQVGVSELLVRWAMFWADKGLNVLYVFPKLQGMHDFSDARVRTLIQNSDYLRQRIPPVHVQNKGLKQIGLGFCYFRGSESQTALESVNADALALDEYDLLKAENVPVAEQRNSASMSPMVRRVGVPMVPEYGIAAQYEESDKRRWFNKCPHCNLRQTVTFHENVDQARGIRLCSKCGKSIEEAMGEGEWVAEHPSREKRGYALSRLLRPGPGVTGANLPIVIKRSQAKAPYLVENFHRRELGEPYVHESGRLSKAALAAAERQYTMSPGHVGGELVTMGVDVASARDLNVRISIHDIEHQKKGALWIGTVETYDDLCALMDRYDVKMAAIDHLPENRLSRSFAERFAGRVYLVRYGGPQTINVFTLDDEMRVITVKRTEAIDATLQMVREQRNDLPVDRPDDYDKHMMAVVRFVEKDELDRVSVGYRSLGPDDYLHAEVYDLVAAEAWRHRQQVEHALREEFKPLDEMMEFQRAALHGDPDEAAYSEGRRYSGASPDEYSPGFRGDE